LINKVDIVKKGKILLFIDKYKDLMAFKEIIPISALKGDNLDVLENKIFDNLPESEKEFADDDISIQSESFLLSEIIREKLLSQVRQELPFVTAVFIDSVEDRGVIEKDPQKKEMKYIKAFIFVEKDNHRKIIIGRQGSLIKKIGIESRCEMEQILDCKIFLDLQVKVKERWRDQANVLDLIERQ
jgi:GTP-binding protein Era